MLWGKNKEAKKKETEQPKRIELGRNDPCHCGSKKKYKKCCMAKDEAAERKTLEENWEKSAAAAKDQAEKKSKETPPVPGQAGSKPTSTQPSSKQQHPTFVPHQVSTPRRSGGG